MHASPYRGQINPFFFLPPLLPPGSPAPHSWQVRAVRDGGGTRRSGEGGASGVPGVVCGVVSSCPVTACSSPLTPPRGWVAVPRAGPRSSDVLHQLVARPGRLVVVYRVLRGPVHDHRPKQAAAAQLEEVYEVPETSVVEGTLYGR